MSQVSISPGGSPIPAGDTITVDQETIVGAGTPHSPLRATSGGISAPLHATLVVGTPVYTKPDEELYPGDAQVLGRALLVGLLIVAGQSGATGRTIATGLVTLTVAEWDAVAGTTGGLVPGAVYYLSATSGKLTGTPPAVHGQYVVQVGVAIAATKLLVALPATPIVVP